MNHPFDPQPSSGRDPWWVTAIVIVAAAAVATLLGTGLVLVLNDSAHP